jgi:hypothetical protein
MKATSAIIVLALALASAARAQQFDIKQKPLVLTEPKPITPLPPGEDFVLHEGESVTMSVTPIVEPQERPGFWTFGSWDRAHPLRTNYEVFHDKAWIATQVVWLGGIAYDVELTHEGIAHHRCEEGNIHLNRHPSRGELYRSDLPEYAIGTAFNVLVLKFLTKPLIFEWPAIAIGKHLQAGSSWLLNCW